MLNLDYGVKLITRAEWGARQPTSVTHLNATFGSTRHWEGPHMGYPWPHESCASKVRGIQNFHMDSRGWTDIAYTGVPCPHGYVFEGRGLFRRTAANGTNTGNNTAYAFCYLGGELDPFTEEGKRAMKAAMNWTRNHGGAGTGRNDHNDWKSTVCPGVVIESWGDSGEVITWEPIPPPPKGTASSMHSYALNPDGNRIDHALIGADGSIWHAHSDTPEGLLSVVYEWLGGKGKSIDTAWFQGEYIVTVQGAGGADDNKLFMKRYTSEGWVPDGPDNWSMHPTAILRDPEANV